MRVRGIDPLTAARIRIRSADNRNSDSNPSATLSPPIASLGSFRPRVHELLGSLAPFQRPSPEPSKRWMRNLTWGKKIRSVSTARYRVGPGQRVQPDGIESVQCAVDVHREVIGGA